MTSADPDLISTHDWLKRDNLVHDSKEPEIKGSPTLMIVDGLLSALGGRSKYQIIQHVLIGLGSLTAALQLLDLIFIGKMVGHQCAPPPNGTNISIDNHVIPDDSTVVYHQCTIDIQYNSTDRVVSRTLPCQYGMQYSERKDVSIISEFDLVCEREFLGDLPQTLIMIGQSVGALVLTFFSDRYGRKLTHIVSHIGCMIVGVAIALSPNYVGFAALRLLMGAFQQGIVLTRSTYAIENYPIKFRRYCSLIEGVMWACSAVMIAPAGVLMRDQNWRHLQLVYTAASLIVIVQIIFLDESFRWLVTNGKYTIAKRNMIKAARINNQNIEMIENKMDDLIRAVVEKDVSAQKLLTSCDTIEIKKYSILDIFKRKHLAINTVILWYLWCTASLCYFGLFFTSTNLTGDPYLIVFLNVLVEIPPCILIFVVIDRIGRKKTAVIFYLMGGVSLLLATVIKSTVFNEAGSIMVTLLSLVGKSGATAAFFVCFFYTPELFPTNLRNVGLGSASVAARVGGMLAPFSRLMSNHIPWGPGAIFGICCILATILVNFLPETMSKPLPQTMADMNILYQKCPGSSRKNRRMT